MTLPLDSIPYGMCKCGCGAKAPVARYSSLAEGIVKGQFLRYLPNHHKRKWIIPSRSSTYNSWSSMLARTSPGYPKAKWYGNKGVAVCERWKNFDLFVEDMGERPSGTSIDRIDGSKGYEPGNCRWATPQEQMNNVSTNVTTTIKGETLTLSQWASRVGMKPGTLYRRYSVGYRGEDLIQPLLRGPGRCKHIRSVRAKAAGREWATEHDIAGSATDAIVRACEMALENALIDEKLEAMPMEEEVQA